MELKLAQELQKGLIAPIYLLYGKESFLIEEAVTAIEQHVLPEEGEKWSRTVLDLEEVSIQEAIREAETPSFFGERRVVIGKNAFFLTAMRSREKVDHQPEELLRYLHHPFTENVLILTVLADKLDARKKVVKELKKGVRLLPCNPLEGKELFRWVSQRLERLTVAVHPQTAERLLQQVGGDLRLLATEMEKLATYVGKEGTITPDTVDKLVPRTLEQDVFKLVDYVARRQADKALYVYEDLLQNREEPIKILALIIRQFRLMLLMKVLSDQGKKEHEIATLLKMHPYPVKLALRHTRVYPEPHLRELLARAIAADAGIKSGKIDKSLAVEGLLFSVAQDKAKIP